ncbi:MAG: hypothetical protein DRI56_00410 [Chloroflexota bacterium]|nr:MAG: hypothetical protein DRI56_00410 [Chloroflexota bacterium]
MSNYRELVKTFQKFEIPAQRPVIVHTSRTLLDDIKGGANTLLGALTATYRSILMPSFTYQTMVIPKVGPENNGLDYQHPPKSNEWATFFDHALAVNPAMGKLAEVARKRPQARRSHHPILSFAGFNVEDILQAQTLSQPLAPIEVLVDQGGWVLLLGIDQTANVSIHHAEQLAGRKQFTRWALTPAGVIECPNIPGCSRGFNAITPYIEDYIRRGVFGSTPITAIPLQALIPIARKLILEDSAALLCGDENCTRCMAVRSEA